MRNDLLNTLLTVLSQENISVNVLLYGCENLEERENVIIISAVHKFIRNSARFRIN